MFLERKGIAVDPNKIKNQIELTRICEEAHERARIGCFQTQKEFEEMQRRAAEISGKWF